MQLLQIIFITFAQVKAMGVYLAEMVSMGGGKLGLNCWRYLV